MIKVVDRDVTELTTQAYYRPAISDIVVATQGCYASLTRELHVERVRLAVLRIDFEHTDLLT